MNKKKSKRLYIKKEVPGNNDSNEFLVAYNTATGDGFVKWCMVQLEQYAQKTNNLQIEVHLEELHTEWNK
jgi:hypothetical protein